MSEIVIRTVQTRRDRNQFATFPHHLYKHDPLWIQPLYREISDTLSPRTNPLFGSGPYSLFIAVRGKNTVGRICAGVNLKMNKAKHTNSGYICMMDSINDQQVADALFHHASTYLRSLNVDSVRGPISPTNGDEYRGVLVDGFDYQPAMFQSYNHPYYQDLYLNYGFTKDMDYYAFHIDLTTVKDRFRAVSYAKRRYNFDTRPIKMKDFSHELELIRTTIARSTPDQWPDLAPPTPEETQATADKLKSVAIPDLIRIAHHQGKPIGVSIALPDYHQVLRYMGGRLFPLGWLTFLRRRKTIDTVRLFIVYVHPEFHKRGVSSALYYDTLTAALNLGYRYADASTVADFNTPMLTEAERSGATRYKTYRIYQLPL